MKKQLGLIGEFLISSRDLSQDLETVCPKLPNGIFWGIPIFKEDHTILRLITTIHKYLLIEIRHGMLIQCHRNYIDMEKL